MADLDHLDQAALREEEQDDDDEDKEKEEDNSADDNDEEDPRALPQQLQLQQQEDDWDDSDREEIDVPDAVTTATTTTTKKQFDDNDEDDDRETIGLDELFASSSKSHTSTANAQSELLQELHYTRLYQAWAQESRSPELLPPLDPVTLEALRQAMTDMDPDDDQQHQQSDNPHINALIQSIRHIDIQRVKFLLADLLKLRLQKIQAHPLHMRTRTDRMSEAEVCICLCAIVLVCVICCSIFRLEYTHTTHSTHFINGNNTRTVG
jgi:hypothetical protein